MNFLNRKMFRTGGQANDQGLGDFQIRDRKTGEVYNVKPNFIETFGFNPYKILYDDSLEKGFLDTDSALYNIKNDPGQINKIEDRDIIKKMNNLIFDKMTENDAPKEVISRFFKN